MDYWTGDAAVKYYFDNEDAMWHRVLEENKVLSKDEIKWAWKRFCKEGFPVSEEKAETLIDAAYMKAMHKSIGKAMRNSL